jgi:hypothetical protein
MDFYKISGSVFIIMSGLIYTLERGFSLLSTIMVRAGFDSGGMTGEVPRVEVNGFLDNILAPLFLILGLSLVIYGFKRK